MSRQIEDTWCFKKDNSINEVGIVEDKSFIKKLSRQQIRNRIMLIKLILRYKTINILSTNRVRIRSIHWGNGWTDSRITKQEKVFFWRKPKWWYWKW